MRTANTHKNMARCAATATLACVLGLGLAAPAYADTASDLAAARTKLEQIGTQTQQIYDELATQTQALDQTAGEITQKQQEIADGQAKLSTYVAGEYKTGGLSLLQVLTGVDDLSDMLNRLFYYGKVSDKQAQTIQEVKELKQHVPLANNLIGRAPCMNQLRQTINGKVMPIAVNETFVLDGVTSIVFIWLLTLVFI